MATDAIVERIVKLLRLAADQEGTPEGRNAAAHAQRLMDLHGVHVLLDDSVVDDTPHQIADVFGTFGAREIWLDGIAHLVGHLYDVMPIWQAADDGSGVLLLVFDLTGDKAHLAAAKRSFLDLVAFVRNEPLPRRLLHNLPPERARFVFRAGVAHAVITRLASSRVERLARDELPGSDETALVHVAVHRRARAPFVDPMLEVPVQGAAAEFEAGPEAVLFAWGINAGRRQFLPPLARVTDDEVLP